MSSCQQLYVKEARKPAGEGITEDFAVQPVLWTEVARAEIAAGVRLLMVSCRFWGILA